MENNFIDLTKTQFNLYKKSWINSSRNGFTVDDNNLPIPWYTFDAIDFLQKNLNCVQKCLHVIDLIDNIKIIFSSES